MLNRKSMKSTPLKNLISHSFKSKNIVDFEDGNESVNCGFEY